MIKNTFLFLAMLFVFLWGEGAFAAEETAGIPSGSSSRLHATHIMGFGSAANNAAGALSVQGNSLRFEKDGSQGEQIPIPSIKEFCLRDHDRQVGGKTLAVTRAALPYGGGRVVGMFSHKKYDIVAIEYVDANNALHGAIFELEKGQGEMLQNELAAAGVPITNVEGQSEKSQNSDNNNEK